MFRRTLANIRLIAWVGLLLVPAPALAQNSGIAGVVKDTSGAFLPGVAVEATSTALIERTRTACRATTSQTRSGPAA